MTDSTFDVGAFVEGGVTAPRQLLSHARLLAAYADGTQLAREHVGEAYLSHYVYGPEMEAHFEANRRSVRGFAGPCRCRWLTLDIDRAGDLPAALAAARRLVAALYRRYPETEGTVPVYFSGNKGFHVLVELAHGPPPAVGFPAVARALAEGIAARAEVRIDTGVYDTAHLIRLPNTRHPKSGLFKRRIDADDLLRLSPEQILGVARHPAGDGMPAVGRPVPQLEADWRDAERVAASAAVTRETARRDAACSAARAPRYLMDFLRFGVEEGDRHRTLFQSAAWLTEQGAPRWLCHALLTEAGCDVGLAPADVTRQIRCGIDHARKKHGAPAPDHDVALIAENCGPQGTWPGADSLRLDALNSA